MNRFLIPSAIFVALAISSLEARTWTSADGVRTFEGEFVSYSQSTRMVTVKTRGRLIEVHEMELSRADREFVLEKFVASIMPSLPTKEPKPQLTEKPLQPPAPRSSQDISDFVSQICNESGLMGLSLGVVKDGKVIGTGCAGKGGKDQTNRIERTDTYIIASCSKPMTATLAAILVEEGKLKWDTTLADVFGEKFKRINRRYESVTLAQLLSHTGGAPEMEEFWQSGELQSAVNFGADNKGKRMFMLEAVLRDSPSARVGTYAYSNAGVCFAASMMEERTGDSWENLMTDKLFKPLEMTATKPTTSQDSNPSVMAPAAGISCTIDDFAKFAAFHIQGFIDRETNPAKAGTKEMNTLFSGFPGVPLPLGWHSFVSGVGGKVFAHQGVNPDFNTEIWLMPEKKMAVVAATPGGMSDSSQRRLERAVEAVLHRFK